MRFMVWRSAVCVSYLDRGLARDLLGQQDQAQRDYQLALSAAPSDEVTRRYALSLGISGDPDRAVQLLGPQLRRSDRAAWRARAMILAMKGRNEEAGQIEPATLPPRSEERRGGEEVGRTCKD